MRIIIVIDYSIGTYNQQEMSSLLVHVPINPNVKQLFYNPKLAKKYMP